MPCPICGGPTRIHDTYLMCDQCERLVGMAPDAVLNKPSARGRTPVVPENPIRSIRAIR